ncbi:MAG: hypothetical protein DWQ44_07280 [Bacteroidetes bacterium]|nr:MAG: hypothetical protein DWQ33_12405 [Bacteroidota bacterium]REJ99817.1 MAG: hypothetical protein DWQ39_12900 [Bacteroidota bacterium]REK34190.1 MAG: hypothetical protein DWQ44_07280 [Bacteroidota bacterium]REK50520.1 MAG: hypothetical protein DWQ48_04190 [Bacteroidota bacterium]
MQLKSFILIFVLFTINLKAQEPELNPFDTLASNVAGINSKIDALNRFKFSGYIQTQFQVADSAGQASFASGDFRPGVDKRIAVRRGRLKLTYNSPANDKGISTSQYVLQVDVTERGVGIKDAYMLLTDKWSGWIQLKAGMFDRPFGNEIGYSSSQRESPERGRMSQILFPGERDLGASLAIQGSKTSNWNWLRAEGGLFNGTGAPSFNADATDFDKKKDFIGRISANKSSASEKIKYGVGASVYNGGFRADNDTLYAISKDANGNKTFMIEQNSFKGHYAERKYTGVDGQFSIDWKPGITTVRAEYIQGEQAGTSSSTSSPRAAVTSNIYKRKFNGAYFYFLQNLGASPLQLVVKYDWYDPNTEVSKDEIGISAANGTKSTGIADIRYDTWGFGMIYRWDSNVRITLYYDMVKNETSRNIPDASTRPTYMKDLDDNVITLRLQVKI